MKKSNTRSFELSVDVKSAVPIYQQIKDAIKMAVFTGKYGHFNGIFDLLVNRYGRFDVHA